MSLCQFFHPSCQLLASTWLIASRSSLPMALTASAATANGLNDALQSFQGVLTVDQRRQLGEIQSVPDADAVLIFTAELDAQNAKRKGRSVATRLYTFLQCARDFSAVVDTFVQSNPEIAALVWGSVKLTMLVGSRKAAPSMVPLSVSSQRPSRLPPTSSHTTKRLLSYFWTWDVIALASPSTKHCTQPRSGSKGLFAGSTPPSSVSASMSWKPSNVHVRHTQHIRP